MQITFDIDPDGVAVYSDEYLAFVWHAAQHNPAPLGDWAAGELVAKVTAEIVRRWLKTTEPSLYHHQPRDHYWSALTQIAKYEPPEGIEPGSPGVPNPEWHNGRWVVRPADEISR